MGPLPLCGRSTHLTAATTIDKSTVRPLSADQFEQYQRDGYLVVEDLFDTERIDSLQSRIREYTHGGRTVPGGTQKQLEPAYERGEINVADRGDAVRKFEWLIPGDDRFTEFARPDGIVDIINHLIGQHLHLYRSGALLKPPEVGSEKGAHQDAPYWPFQPSEQVSVWIPLDDATPENGCMSVVPGGHLEGALPHVETEDDYVIDPDHYDKTDLVEVPMDAGARSSSTRCSRTTPLRTPPRAGGAPSYSSTSTLGRASTSTNGPTGSPTSSLTSEARRFPAASTNRVGLLSGGYERPPAGSIKIVCLIQSSRFPSSVTKIARLPLAKSVRSAVKNSWERQEQF